MRAAVRTPFLLTEEQHVANAALEANLAHDFLQQLGIKVARQPKRSQPNIAYPGRLMCEIAAIARLAAWQAAGIKSLIAPELPDAEAALADLNRRFIADSQEVLEGPAMLLQQVLRAWRRHCSPIAVATLGVDFVCESPPSDKVDELLGILINLVASRG